MPEEYRIMDELLLTHKQCTICKSFRTRDSFCSYYKSKDGLNDRCRDCIKERDKIRWDKLRSDEEWHKEYLKKLLVRGEEDRLQGKKTKYNPEWSSKYVKDPIKSKARQIMSNAITSGRLVPEPCVVCGEEKTEGHHEDYSRPLDIIWLCRTHHKEIHRKFNTLRERLGLK
jgi:hypothetical protein